MRLRTKSRIKTFKQFHKCLVHFRFPAFYPHMADFLHPPIVEELCSTLAAHIIVGSGVVEVSDTVMRSPSVRHPYIYCDQASECSSTKNCPERMDVNGLQPVGLLAMTAVSTISWVQNLILLGTAFASRCVTLYNPAKPSPIARFYRSGHFACRYNPVKIIGKVWLGFAISVSYTWIRWSTGCPLLVIKITRTVAAVHYICIIGCLPAMPFMLPFNSWFSLEEYQTPRRLWREIFRGRPNYSA